MLSADRYRRAKRLFLEASAPPRGERTSFLVAQCGADAALEAQVRRLLTVDEGDTVFLERAALDDGAGLAAGTRLGGFRIIRMLGEGGMGVVYEAEQDEPARRVALKLIRPGYFSERLRSRFRHEIRVLGQLRHPGVAQIYEAGAVDLSGQKLPYFAMELVEGQPLLTSARERGLGVRERLGLIAQVCDAAHHAHQKGVIHRDLKPGNIIVEEAATTDSGESAAGLPLQVKILDFGVARAIDTDVATAALTHSGQMVGTLPYMSPEQVAGGPGVIDTRSDVYAIGVIACELLTGRLPYELEGAPLPEAARIIRESEPARLGSRDRALRGDIETIVARALQKDPRQRYQSAAEFAADIRRHLRDEPILARPPSALYQLRKFARRHKPLVLAAGAVLLAMVAATVISTWQAGVAVRARDLAEEQRTRADASAAAARREARRATFAGAAAAIDSGDPITARRLLEAADAAEQGAGAWPLAHWRARLDQSVAMISPGGRIAGAWVSPDGEEVAIVGEDGAVRRGSAFAGDPPVVARLASSPVASAVFTDDGQRIIAAGGEDGRRLDVFDASGGELLQHVADLERRAGLLAASGDGSVIGVGVKHIPGEAPADSVWLWREAGGGWGQGQQLRQDRRISSLAVSGDGRWIALAHATSEVWSVGDLRESVVAPFTRAGLQQALSADGSLLATGGEDKTITIWDRAGARPLVTLPGHLGGVTALALDASGRVLASAGRELTIRLWDVRNGELLATLGGHTGRIRRLKFAVDSARLMSISDDQSVRLWQRDPDEGVSILRGHGSYVYGVAFTPDGRRLVSGAWDETVRVWDAAGGSLLSVVPPRPEPDPSAAQGRVGPGEPGRKPAPPGFVTAVAVSPDGRWIVAGHKTDEWERGSVRVLDAHTGRHVRDLPWRQGGVCDIVFAPDGARMWIAWEHHGADELDLGAAALDSSEAPPSRTVIQRGGPSAIALSPDGRALACARGTGEIWLLDLASGEWAGILEGHRTEAAGLVFHPTRRLLASASLDGTARLWDLDTGAVRVLEGHWDKVYAVAFSPDGALLATGSEDTTIALWDVESGEQLTQLRGHSAYVYDLEFSPDGSRLASASGDHTVRIWDTRPVHERWRARMGPAREGGARQHDGAEAPTAAPPASSDH